MRALGTIFFGVLAAWSLAAAQSMALPILDLFNTGVLTDDNDGLSATFLPAGTPDPHYLLTSSPTAGDIAEALTNAPVWVVNGPDSQWIGSALSSGDGAVDVPFGDYMYESTFTLPPGADLSSVEITLLAATDNALTDLALNGVSTGITQTGFGLLTGLVTIDSSNGTFMTGVNTLQWTVFNEPIATPSGANPHGFRVDHIRGSYALVPEPATLTLAGVALAMIIGRRFSY